MYYITAFPDTDYFLWQTQVQHYNFLKKGINLNNVICLVSYQNNVINPKFVEYSKKVNATIIFYKDEIPNRTYVPSIRPNLLKRFFKDNPFSNDYMLFHDSDIIFRKVPNFEGMKDGKWHLADTVGYIGYQYLKTTRNDILDIMCNIVGIDKDTVIRYNNKSGGGQYFGKNSTFEMWNKIEKDTAEIYSKIYAIEQFQKEEITKTGKTNSENIIQAWTAGMWAELYNLWFFNNKTVIDKELDFSWADNYVDSYNKHNIYHNAGVIKEMDKDFFFKGNYINKSPFEEQFNYTADKACYYYVQDIIETKQWLIELGLYGK
jgi:hypothetical protein